MTDRTTEEAFKRALHEREGPTGDTPGYPGLPKFFPDQLEAARWGWQAAIQWQAEQQKRCEYCDGTGDVHSPDGQWRGVCSCPAGKSVAASPHGVPPQPSSIQQRAIYLHEKAAMPWPDAEELALNEAGIDARAIDELIGECGYALSKLTSEYVFCSSRSGIITQ